MYPAAIPTESERVASWRLEQALELAVSLELAEEFAVSDGDLHRLAELVDAGCPPDVAARILT
jgi:hypothetical protein